MNNIILSGNLGRDAELKYFEGGKNVANFNIAVQGYNDKTIWVSCRKWNAEKLVNYLTKGKKVIVQGELNIDEYEKDGVKITRPFVNVQKLEFAGGKEENKPADQPVTIESNYDAFMGEIPF